MHAGELYRALRHLNLEVRVEEGDLLLMTSDDF